MDQKDLNKFLMASMRENTREELRQNSAIFDHFYPDGIPTPTRRERLLRKGKCVMHRVRLTARVLWTGDCGCEE